MPDIRSLWQLLDSRPSRAGVMAEWRAVTDGGLPAVRQLLAPLERRATAYPNPRPGGRPLRVVRQADGAVVAIDKRDWRHRLALTAGDIVLYQVDLRKLRKAISDALGEVLIARTPMDEGCAAVQVGTWEPKKSASFPVHLLLAAHPGRLREQLLALVAQRGKSGAIVLTPTRTWWAGDFEALAREWKMVTVPLCEALDLTPAGLVANGAWEEYLDAFCQMVKLTLPSNYRNKKPLPRRAELTAKIEKLKKALTDYIYSARDYVVASMDADRGAVLPGTLTKVQLAELAELKPYHITRCFDADRQLPLLFEVANDASKVLAYGKSRRR